MLDFMLCALTNLFRIFLIGRCVSVFWEQRRTKRKSTLFTAVFMS